MLERDIQSAILDLVRLKGYFAWKNNTVGIYKKATNTYIPSHNVGSPDIFAIKKGKMIGIEVKSGKNKQSESQKEWQKNFEEAGGVYILAYGLEDVIPWI